MNRGEKILRCIHKASAEKKDLIEVLDKSDINGASLVAEKLRKGEPLTEALATIIPEKTSAYLCLSHMPLSNVISILLNEMLKNKQRNETLVKTLSYPIVSLLCVLCLSVLFHSSLPRNVFYENASSYLFAIIPASLGLFYLLLSIAPSQWNLTGLSWVAHLQKSSTWNKAALATELRLNEAQAQALLRIDLARLTMQLQSPSVHLHCEMLADWHHQAAKQKLLISALVLSAFVFLTAGALVIASFQKWTGITF